MHRKLITPFVIACLAGSAVAQTMPTTLTQTATYSQAAIFGGGTWGAGGIHFDATGQFLYLSDMTNNTVVKVTCVRNASGKITGFTTPTTVMTSATTGWLDGGLSLSNIGTLMAAGYQPADLEQISFASKAQTLINLGTNANLLGSTGGCDFLGTGPTQRFLVSDYDNGGIFEVPLTLLANLTYSVGNVKPYLKTIKGVEGFAVVPTGPFGKNRGLVVVNYDNGTLDLVAINPTTLNPLTDKNGNPMVIPVISGLYAPMDVEFDPLTGDMFISDYGSGTRNVALLQFAGTVGGRDGDFNLYGPGCPLKNGQVPTLSTLNTKLRAGFPITFLLARGPSNQPTSFLAFGAGDTGNVGGFQFAGTTCRVHVNPLVIVPYPTNAQGVASLALTIPSVALGVTIFVQSYALAPGANPLNLVLSDAATSLIAK